MKEIGSDFWLDFPRQQFKSNDFPEWLLMGDDNKLLLSGRTAIDFILKDILIYRKVETVYFPSYSCQSMLQPFIDQGITVYFYDVDFDDNGGLKFDIDKKIKCDIFFAMNYFGYSKGRMDNYIDHFKSKSIILEDSTHSLLSTKVMNRKSDYVVASLRKWFPIISGGLAVKNKGLFHMNVNNITHNTMIEIRKLAMIQKQKYMEDGNSIQKNAFLKNYSLSNNILKAEYAGYSIDSCSYRILQYIDTDAIKKRRRENVNTLYNSPSLSKTVKFLFSRMEEGDCPIFLPIISNSLAERNTLRSFLSRYDVYTPIHWAKPTMISSSEKRKIYNHELSLVIDQRYRNKEMKYIERRLLQFYEE